MRLSFDDSGALCVLAGIVYCPGAVPPYTNSP